VEVINRFFDDFTPEQSRQLAALQGLYADWNSQINVISRKDMAHFYEHHVLHSLAIAACYAFGSGHQVMDLGCGGGFPGIPLAIYFPDTHFHLVDSINKKLKVVEGVAGALGLRNVTVQHSRAEDIQGRQFDAVVSRAVAPLGNLWGWSRPLLKKPMTGQQYANGLICLKGGDLAQEIQESGCKPRVTSVEQLLEGLPFFKDKYVLHVPL
jgi:16S rRNA (guanine527-N7)-methyltransferase